MQNPTRPRLMAGVVAGVLAATVQPVAAAGPNREPSAVQGQPDVVPEYTKIGAKKLITTYFQGDTVRFGLGAGFSAIGTPVKFTCTNACTVVVQTMVQVEHTSPYWAICPTIDGRDAIQGCNWQGLASSPTSTYVTGNGTYFWQLPAGTHTLQPQIYFSVTGGLDNWGLTLAKYQ